MVSSADALIRYIHSGGGLIWVEVTEDDGVISHAYVVAVI